MSEAKRQVVKELHKPTRIKFIRRRTIVKGFDDLWQSDLAEFRYYGTYNRGYKYILIVMDCYSKYLWTRPLKEKSASEVTNAMASILKEGRVPKNLQTDNGKEFYNMQFKNLMEKYGINHYSTFSTMKAAMAERVIRTLKSAIYKEFSLRGSLRWWDVLERLTLEYNNRTHRTTGLKPIDVTKSTDIAAFHNLKIAGKAKFKVGDVVRISKQRTVFEKGYTPNWTTELFKIAKVQITNPVTYLLQDMNDQPIKGGFYEQEIQKAKFPDVYLVEKVLRKKGSKVYVKWLGLNEKSWINKSDIV